MASDEADASPLIKADTFYSLLNSNLLDFFLGDGQVATDISNKGGRDCAARPAQRALPGGHVQRQPLPHHPSDFLPHH